VPIEPRLIWRQRLRWIKGAHLFVASPGSTFFKQQEHMSFWQKSLYWTCPVCNFIQVWAEPILITLPLFCLVFDICPYGMDQTLFASHLIFFAVMSLKSIYHDDLWDIGNALRVKSGNRILYFTSVKAVLNTLMVSSGMKPRGHFKFTPKSGLAGNGGEAVADTVVLGEALNSRKKNPLGHILPLLHYQLSRITEMRQVCMPLDGTFDVWVLLGFMFVSLTSALMGFVRLVLRKALISWNDNGDALLWIGVVFALVDSVPGLLFCGCAYQQR
jgi:hypothetical protein